jgi:ankyrin repeat protein
MLHTAAKHSRSDCVPLLLAAGVDVTALNGTRCTALELACEQRDVLTVQLLLDAGGWLPEHGFNCLFSAARTGSSDVLELLIAAAASTDATAAGTAAADSSAVAHYMRCTTSRSDYTLMHAAAAARSLNCAELLLRHGVDAAAMSTARPSLLIRSFSALDLLVQPSPLALRSRCAARELEPADFDKFALLLLSCGATIEHSAMKDQYYTQLAGAMQQHTDRLQQLSTSRARVAAVHAAASWQQCDSSGASSSQDDSSTVKVRLMHAVTQQRGSKLYTVDTKLLSQLYASAVAAATSTAAAASSSSDVNDQSSSSSSGSGATVVAVQQSVLMKMIVPPEGWQSTVENGVKLISYDGKRSALDNVQS